jgi:hypothetical protein
MNGLGAIATLFFLGAAAAGAVAVKVVSPKDGNRQLLGGALVGASLLYGWTLWNARAGRDRANQAEYAKMSDQSYRTEMYHKQETASSIRISLGLSAMPNQWAPGADWDHTLENPPGLVAMAAQMSR